MSRLNIVPHVDAIFGGKSVRFELYRDPSTVKELEAAVGSANAAWGRFMLGTWTVGDIRTVLALAHPRPAQRQERGLYLTLRSELPEVSAISGQIARLIGQPGRRTSQPQPQPEPKPQPQPQRERRGVPPDWIDAVLAPRPLATYAPLAGLVLQAAMIGVPAPLAKFDERGALDALREQYGETSGDGEAAA